MLLVFIFEPCLSHKILRSLLALCVIHLICNLLWIPVNELVENHMVVQNIVASSLKINSGTHLEVLHAFLPTALFLNSGAGSI